MYFIAHVPLPPKYLRNLPRDLSGHVRMYDSTVHKITPIPRGDDDSIKAHVGIRQSTCPHGLLHYRCGVAEASYVYNPLLEIARLQLWQCPRTLAVTVFHMT